MEIKYIDGLTLKKMILSGAAYLEKNKSTVDGLNVFPVPDGDTGTNMSLTMNSAVKQLNNISNPSITIVADTAATGSLMGARGNSGVILSQLFRGISKYCKEQQTLNARQLALALKEGADTAYKAVMKPIEGTILTVARESADMAIRLSKNTDDIDLLLEQTIEHGIKTLDKTPDMLPVLKAAGVVDAGGKGFIFILQGALAALRNQDIGVDSSTTNVVTTTANAFTFEEHEEVHLEFEYCTEFIINSKNGDLDKLRESLIVDGDCLLVVGDPDLIKVHVHTNNPGEVLQKALGYGYLTNIKIDNMRVQHDNVLLSQQSSDSDFTIAMSERSKYGIISVAMGKGLSEIFTDLGVTNIIEGGQTMNPSTEDFVKAINGMNVENVIILPNNSNIILAANQARELSDKEVVVIPSKSIPQGISALLNFDGELEINENEESMLKAMSKVKTAQVTYAVRTTNFNGKDINEGDIIGIGDGSIKQVGKEVADISQKLLLDMVDENDEIITIFYGEDMSEEEANLLKSSVSKVLPNIDVEVHYGGQPLYYYIFSIE